MANSISIALPMLEPPDFLASLAALLAVCLASNYLPINGPRLATSSTVDDAFLIMSTALLTAAIAVIGSIITAPLLQLRRPGEATTLQQ